MKEYPERPPNPVCALLPLLASVQISLLASVRRQRPSLPNVTRSNGNLSKDHPETPARFTLCYLCLLLFKYLLLASVRRQRPSLPNVTRSNGNLSKDHPGTPARFTLCYLCLLLFKYLLLASVRRQRPSLSNVTRSNGNLSKDPSRNASPVYPLLPLLASVQILFASFCPL